MSETSVTEDVLIAREGRVLVITLNRPKALNALSLDMIRVIDPALTAAAADPSIACVVIEGAGEKAFCAGGDVRAVAQSTRDPQATLWQDFFREEYRLNHRIHTYPKPFIALVRGISMGGGVGLSVHGSHRVVTESLTFAMPETGIGLFPDVGGTWFLTRCPGRTGMYLALTGARLKAADAAYIGYATHVVPDAALADLRAALVAEGPADRAAADAVIARFAVAPGPAPLAHQQAMIDRLFAGDSVEAILHALEADGGDWARTQLEILSHKSPTSLKLTFRQIQDGAGLEIGPVLVREYRMTQRCMQAGDFYEGIRALLIDKDQSPRWSPARLEDVSPAEIDRYFAPPATGDLTFD